MREPKKLARVAGFLYLLVAVFTIFAGVVNTRVAESGEAGATADAIAASATLYRVGLVSEMVGATAFLMTAMALYLLLRHVHPMAAAAMVTFVAVSVAIQSLNLLNQQTALAIATGEDFAFGPTGSDQLATLFVDMRHDGYLIAQTYFGLWLLPLGYLVIRSGYFPRVLGVLLIIGCIGHLTDVFARFLAPDLGASISPFVMTPPAIAEVSFIVWLLVRSVRESDPGTRAPAVARPAV
ncbi:DUF4386 domain-containing protein [Nocardiopsis sp. NPDC049922]|uniref:DUF4386 domain-containing protein n=1 Tax=Nocardiopsis sp. NPDC049922 TaxID=3155157 RepID=UPI0033F6F1F7